MYYFLTSLAHSWIVSSDGATVPEPTCAVELDKNIVFGSCGGKVDSLFRLSLELFWTTNVFTSGLTFPGRFLLGWKSIEVLSEVKILQDIVSLTSSCCGTGTFGSTFVSSSLSSSSSAENVSE